MDTNLVERLTDGIFSKALQVRRMLRRGSTEIMSLPLAEIVVLAGEVERLLTGEELERGRAAVAGQRWHKPTVELGLREGYARWAADYDDEANPLIALEEPVVMELVGDITGRDVLDAACGTGRYAIPLAQAGARVTGIDISEVMLGLARQKASEHGLSVDLRAADLRQLPFPDASFDVMVCALALCHLPELRQAVSELSRVLRPGGRLIVSDFHPFCLLIGWRTALHRADATYWIENHLHLTQDYVGALMASGLAMTDFREAVVDERAVPPLAEEDVERYRGWPAALVISAVKGGCSQ